MSPRRWIVLVTRSLVAGAAAGVLAGGLIFFGFGFIGFTGGDLLQRATNGWRAATSFGIRRGLSLGLGIAAGLTFAFLLWNHLTRGFESRRARAWLTLAAFSVMVVGNLDVIRAFGGWDGVAILTVVFMSLVAGAAVWWVTPWVLRSAERIPV